MLSLYCQLQTQLEQPGRTAQHAHYCSPQYLGVWLWTPCAITDNYHSRHVAFFDALDLSCLQGSCGFHATIHNNDRRTALCFTDVIYRPNLSKLIPHSSSVAQDCCIKSTRKNRRKAISISQFKISKQAYRYLQNPFALSLDKP